MPAADSSTHAPNVPTLVEQRGVLRRTDWLAALSGGIIAGIVSLAVSSLFGLATDDNLWGPTHRIAAMVLGPAVLSPAPEFPPQVVAVGLALHLALSALYGVLVGWLVHRLHTAAALAVGVGFGLVAMFGLNFYLVAPALFPWFVEVRTLATALAHAIFGLVAAGAYVALRRARSGPTRVWRQS